MIRQCVSIWPRIGALCAALLLAQALAVADEPGPMTDMPAEASGNAPTLPPELLDQTWEWVNLQTPKDLLLVTEPSNYTMTLMADGSAAFQLDCNRGMGSFELKGDQRITFTPIASTMMACGDDSLAQQFTSNLEMVAIYFQQDGDFFLELPFDSGTLRFRPAQGGS